MPVRVIDQNSGSPIGGAKIVTLCLGTNSGTYFTDFTGYATVIAVDHPVVGLTVSAAGYSNVSIAVTPKTLQLALSKIQP